MAAPVLILKLIVLLSLPQPHLPVLISLQDSTVALTLPPFCPPSPTVSDVRCMHRAESQEQRRLQALLCSV